MPGGAITAGSLVHIAMSKTSSGIYIGTNGAMSSPVAVLGTPQSSTSGVVLTIGQINNRSINGHVKAIRITKGVGASGASGQISVARLTLRDRTANP